MFLMFLLAADQCLSNIWSLTPDEAYNLFLGAQYDHVLLSHPDHPQNLALTLETQVVAMSNSLTTLGLEMDGLREDVDRITTDNHILKEQLNKAIQARDYWEKAYHNLVQAHQNPCEKKQKNISKSKPEEPQNLERPKEAFTLDDRADEKSLPRKLPHKKNPLAPRTKPLKLKTYSDPDSS